MLQPASQNRRLTGRWVGHYVQRGQRHPIEAELIHNGERLSGTMRDLETDFEMSVFELAAESGLPPGADEAIIAWLRRNCPGNANRPIRAAMSVPSGSSLEGTLRGRMVQFVKTYQGDSFCGYQVGEERVGRSVAGHTVQYRGELSEDGTRIEGAWWIDANPQEGVRRSEGTFVLKCE
jgi:hypothetical protein